MEKLFEIKEINEVVEILPDFYTKSNEKEDLTPDFWKDKK